MKQLYAIQKPVITTATLRRAFIFTVPNKSICYWSSAMFELLGIEPVEFPKLELLFDMIHGDDQVKVMDIYHTFVEENSSEYVVEFRLKDDVDNHIFHLYAQQEEFGEDSAILLLFKPSPKSQMEIIPGGEIANELKKDHVNTFFESVGYWEYSPDSKEILCSNHIYHLLDVSPEDVISYKTFVSSVFPQDLAAFRQILGQITPESPEFEFETRHIIRNDLFYAFSRGSSLWNGSRLIKLMGSFEDVSSYHMTLERLQRVEQISKVGWYEVNLSDKTKSIASVQYLKMHGFEFTNRMPSINELLACIHPDDHEKVIDSRNRLYNDFSDWLPFEYRVVLADGTTKYMESTGRVLSSPLSNQPFKVLAVTKDITDLKIKELQLRHANELAQLGWYELDIKQDHMRVSKEFLAIHSLHDYDHERMRSRIHPDDINIFDAIREEFQKYEHGYSYQYRVVLDSGDYRFVQNIGKYVHDPVTGDLVKVLGTVQDISKFKSLEDRLRRAQKISQTGWFEYDIKNPMESSFSQEWLDMHDFDYEPYRLTDFLDKIHPQDRHQIPSLNDFLNRMPAEWDNLEYRIVTRYGHKRFISNSARVLFKDNSPAKIFGTTIDVTKSRATENALKESERKYRLMSENSRDAILLLEAKDKGMVITFASDYVEDLSGYSKYRLLGMEATQLMHKEDRIKFTKEIIPKLLFAKESTSVIFRLFRADGEFVWVEANIGVLIEETPVKVQLSVRDITERKEFEEQLLKSNNDLKAMIKATEDIVFIIKNNLTIEGVIVNDESKLNRPSSEFYGEPIEKMWSDDDGKIICGLVREAFETRSYRRHDYSRTLDGNYEWYRAHVHSFIGYDQEERISVMIEKITTQKRAEEELRKTMEMERELSKMRASFVSMASHQFRTPLTVIKSNMQLLELSGQTSPLIQKVSTRLVREVDRMVGLMEDILMLGKVQSGAIKPRLKNVDLEEMMASIKADVDVSQPDKRCLDLKVQGQRRLLKLDEGLMRQAVLNLITNAFKYSQGCSNPLVTIDYSGNKAVQLSVEDFGLGISEKNLSRIFKDFYRSENVGHIPGTGLGLSVTSEFLKINDCKISVTSELDKGSKFTVLIPKNK